MNKKHLAAFAAVATIVFSFAGCASNSAQKAADHAAANPVVTKPARTVTTTVNVPTVPQSCLDALDKADLSITTSGEGFDILADAFNAASTFDAAGIEAATVKLQTLTNDKMKPALQAYKTARDTCKAAQ